MLIAERQQSWLDRRRAGLLHPVISFTEDRLELGLGTVLARMVERGEKGRILDLTGREARILASLAAAYQRPVSPQVLDNIRRAGREWSRGEACLAQIDLALTGLPKLEAPDEASYRLFVADELMETGTPPRDILLALDLDPGPIDLLDKGSQSFNPAELRVPPGSGRISGEWTIGEAVSAVLSAAKSLLNLSAENLSALGEFAARFASPAVALGNFFIPSPAMPGPVEGEIPGRPELRYRWNADEGSLLFLHNTGGNWAPLIEAHKGLDSIYRDSTHRPIGREIDGHIVIDMAAATAKATRKPQEAPEKPLPPFPAPLPLQRDADDEPRLCPKPAPDKPGRKGDENPQYKKDLDYEDYVKAMVILGNPTPRGFGVQLPNPEKDGKLVFYDDCQRHTNWMFEYKGTGYARRLIIAELKPDRKSAQFMKLMLEKDWLDQAGRQIAASGGRPVVWVFAEKAARDFARKLFDDEKNGKLKRIETVWQPWPEASK